MRSGREHLAWILAVEVRQGTLGVDGRGREHWAGMVVVEVRQGTPRVSTPSVPCRTSPRPSPPSVPCHDHPRPVFPAGPQPRPSTPSVPCRTSTAGIPAQCSLPDLNHDHHRQCSLPDLNWAWMVVVEVRQGTLGVDGRG